MQVELSLLLGRELSGFVNRERVLHDCGHSFYTASTLVYRKPHPSISLAIEGCGLRDYNIIRVLRLSMYNHGYIIRGTTQAIVIDGSVENTEMQ